MSNSETEKKQNKDKLKQKFQFLLKTLDLNTCVVITAKASHKTGENINKCLYLLHTR